VKTQNFIAQFLSIHLYAALAFFQKYFSAASSPFSAKNALTISVAALKPPAQQLPGQLLP